MNEKRITDFTVGGKCSNCGQCCGGVLPLRKADIANIHAYMRDHEIKEQHGNVMMGGVDLSCPFRDDVRGKCLVYEVRPEICRRFMCNYSLEDIMRVKHMFHERFDVVFMRSEFFGNKDAEEAFKTMQKLLIEMGVKKQMRRGSDV